MKQQYGLRIIRTIALAGLVGVMGAAYTYGQFSQDKKADVEINSKEIPKDIQPAYHVFMEKCSECHEAESSLKLNMESSQWQSEVKRMEAMASSQFNDGQAASILKFLNYDEALRAFKQKPTSGVTSSDSVMIGRQLYSAQGCDACHSIEGKGGSMGSLDGVGTRLSREQLVHRLAVPSAGSVMPALPADTSEVQIGNLVDYLLTLKGH